MRGVVYSLLSINPSHNFISLRRLQMLEIPKIPTLIEDLGTIYPTATSKHRKRYGIYKCQCGVEFKAQSAHIKNGNTKSCGCYMINKAIETHTTHGLKNHPLYSVWRGMKTRCYYIMDKSYKYYGMRGITVCNRWGEFKNFYDDMKDGYKDGLSIDRINNNLGYSPENCRWATMSTQLRNTRIKRSTNTSGYRGVTFHKRVGKFQAAIGIDKKLIYLGLFTTSLEAAVAYDSYVIANNLEHTMNGVL